MHDYEEGTYNFNDEWDGNECKTFCAISHFTGVLSIMDSAAISLDVIKE